jgi:uroporphyrinogen-III synthase
MSVLVTRAAPGGEMTAERLRSIGRQAIVSPVLVVEPVAAAPDFAGVQALLVTSPSGAAALAAFPAARSIPALAVGAATAEVLRAQGFAEVRSADADGAALAYLAQGILPRAGGKVLHVRGERAAVDVAELLRAEGYDAASVVLYRARRADALSAEAVAALDQGKIEAVLLHSAAGAEAFMLLAEKAQLMPRLSRISALALSARAAAPLAGEAWRDIRIATRPDERSLLALLDQGA